MSVCAVAADGAPVSIGGVDSCLTDISMGNKRNEDCLKYSLDKLRMQSIKRRTHVVEDLAAMMKRKTPSQTQLLPCPKSDVHDQPSRSLPRLRLFLPSRYHILMEGMARRDSLEQG